MYKNENKAKRGRDRLIPIKKIFPLTRIEPVTHSVGGARTSPRRKSSPWSETSSGIATPSATALRFPASKAGPEWSRSLVRPSSRSTI